MSLRPSQQEWSRPTLDNWQDPPYNRWSFSHLSELVATLPIARGAGPISPLPAEHRALDELALIRSDGTASTVGDVWDTTYTDALVIVHGGAVAVERYEGETVAETTHLLMSVSKSLVSCVLGCLVDKELIDTERQVTAYVPELKGSGYEGAKIQDLLDMRSGVAFSEVYNDPNSEVRLIERSFGWRTPVEGETPGSFYEFLTGLKQEMDHGGPFRYRSCETDVLGWVCERASGQAMADLLSSLIWAPMGAEHDAEVSCDGTGAAIHDGGICATARDLARFGALLLDLGHVGDRAVVPEAWLRTAWKVDADLRGAFAQSDSGPYMPGGWYHNQFWFEPRVGGDVQLCLGIYGQMVYVNPFTGLVGAKLSSWPEPQSPAMLEDTLRAFDAVGGHLSAKAPPTHEGLPGVAAGMARNRAASNRDVSNRDE